MCKSCITYLHLTQPAWQYLHRISSSPANRHQNPTSPDATPTMTPSHKSVSHSTPNSFLTYTISAKTVTKAIIPDHMHLKQNPFAACTDISHIGPLPTCCTSVPTILSSQQHSTQVLRTFPIFPTTTPPWAASSLLHGNIRAGWSGPSQARHSELPNINFINWSL